MEKKTKVVPRMFREVKEYGLREPELINLGSDFRLNLYRRSPETDEYGVIHPKNSAQFGTTELPNESRIVPNISKNIEDSAELTEQELKIVQYIRENGEITTMQVVELLTVKERRTRSILSGLSKKKILKKVGVTRNTVYLAGEYFPK